MGAFEAWCTLGPEGVSPTVARACGDGGAGVANRSVKAWRACFRLISPQVLRLRSVPASSSTRARAAACAAVEALAHSPVRAADSSCNEPRLKRR